MTLVYDFVFLYPLLMAFVWIFGSIIFKTFRKSRQESRPELPEYPLVSIIIPCHNEEDCIEETITRLRWQQYPNYEIIAINDASTDNTARILQKLQQQNSQLRVITLSSNQGKGTGLNMGALASRGEFLVCIDADAILDPNAIVWLMWHFQHPRVGAVTGNPKVRNRTSILAKIQTTEFSSIIGMIKRSQRVLGKIFTVSGVIAAFRKKALLDVGFWSNNMVTEDIDISWKLQLRRWDVRYEPRALCWILVPETLKGIFRQRLRWSQGGNEVLLKYYRCVFNWRQRRIWPLYLEYLTSVVWCYCFSITLALWLTNLFVELPPPYVVRSITPGWTGVILASVCLLQLCVGIWLDAQYDKTLRGLIVWVIWFPAIYWLINWLVTIISLPKAIFKKRSALAIWESPDRGL